MKNPFKPNLIRLPESFDRVTDIRHQDEVDPTSLGLPASITGQIWRDVEKLYASRAIPGISLAIRHKGQIVMNRAIGHARGNGPQDGPESHKLPMTPDTPVCLFSASKAITAMLVHKAAEEGLIRLHDPVAEYIPEFGTNGKQYITVGQVLSHKSGIPTIKQKEPDPTILWDWDACVQLLCDARPRKDAGNTQAYHAITGGFILGEILRRVTGENLNNVLRSRIAEPLGSRHMTLGLPRQYHDQVALNYHTGPSEFFPLDQVVKRALGGTFDLVCEVSNSPDFLNATIPAGNIYGTALDVCDFFQCLLNGGTFNGKRLFDRATVARAISEASSRQLDRTLLMPLRTSEGLMLGDYPYGLYGPSTREAFGHLGFICIYCWADPTRDISVSLLTTGKPIVTGHLPRLLGLLNTINRSFPKFAGQ